MKATDIVMRYRTGKSETVCRDCVRHVLHVTQPDNPDGVHAVLDAIDKIAEAGYMPRLSELGLDDDGYAHYSVDVAPNSDRSVN